jgi:catechol O-methyltransferase
VFNQPNIEEIRGSPQKVLQAIDQFGQTKHFLMNVGQAKGKIVTELIAQVKPKMMLELGGYVGYSAIMFGDALRRAGGKTYLSLERNPEFGAISTMLVDLAGLRDVVRVIIGPADQSLKRLHAAGDIQHIELMFLDHWKAAYPADLKLCEQLGMVSQGTVVAADNVICPGAPEYLEYVRSSVDKKRANIREARERDGLPSYTPNQDLNELGDGKPSFALVGNPNLIYETKLVDSFEPTGNPVCVCPSALEENPA